MIIFQLTLSGRQIRTLVGIKNHNWYERDKTGSPDHFITSVRSLVREGLITHENPCDCDKPTKWKASIGRGGVPQHYHTKRKDSFQITTKGELTLQVIAMDLQDFIKEVEETTKLPNEKKKVTSGRRRSSD